MDRFTHTYVVDLLNVRQLIHELLRHDDAMFAVVPNVDDPKHSRKVSLSDRSYTILAEHTNLLGL